jgi:hypothetical protein
MSTSVLVSVVSGGALALLVLVLLLVAVTRKKRGQASRLCGGCRRVMMPQWDRCLFCGWVPVPRLEFLCGPLMGQVVYLTDEVTTIGSIAGNNIVLADPAVSRKHVGIRRHGAAFEMADLGSTNGVYVNGHKMPKKQLFPGDILRVGNTEMVFRRE